MFLIENSVFHNNSCEFNGGALYLKDIKLKLKSSHCFNNTAKNSGGCLYSIQNLLK